MDTVFTIFIDGPIVVVPCANATTSGAKNNTGFGCQFTAERDARLRDCLSSCGKGELGEPIIERHLLAVVTPICLKPAHLATNLN